MNRIRKRIEQSEQEESVSIFDSDQEYVAPHLQPQKQKTKDKEPVPFSGKKPDLRAIQKKLSQEEQQIMRLINGKINEKQENVKIENQVKIQQQSINQNSLSTNLPKNSYFQANGLPKEAQLTWEDLQEMYRPKSTVNSNYKPGDISNQQQMNQNNLFETRPNVNNKWNNYQQQSKPILAQRRPVGRPKKKQGYIPISKPSKPVSKYALQPNKFTNHVNPYQADESLFPRRFKAQFTTPSYNPYHKTITYQPSLNYNPYNNQFQPEDYEKTYKELNKQLLLYSKPAEQFQMKFDLNGLEDDLMPETSLNQQDHLQKKQQQMKRKRDKILADIKILQKQFIKLQDKLEQYEEQTIIKQLSEKTGVKANSINKLYQSWKYEPELLQMYESIKIPKEEDNKGSSKSQLRIVLLEQLIKRNPFLTQSQMAEVLKAIDPQTNSRIDRSAVLRVLKTCGIVKKRLQFSSKNLNTAESINQRQKYAAQLRQYKDSNYQIHYYDEYIVNQFFDKDSGWCKTEEQVTFTIQKFISRSFIIMGLISQDGRLRWALRFGNPKDHQFSKIISEMLKDAGQEHNNVLVVNPLRYRKPHIFHQVASRRGWQLLTLPSESSSLNPLRQYFYQIREMLKRRKYENLEEIYAELVIILRQFQGAKLGARVISKLNLSQSQTQQKLKFQK